MARDPFQSEEAIQFTGENIGDFLLNVLTVGLYNQPDLIVREYIQNSHDAICDWPNQPAPGRVDIQVSWPNIHIFDNGPGMDRNELLHAMSNLGKSFKNISTSSGFMGIGKLAGLSMASRVEIHSSKYDIPEKNWVVFNSEEMLTGIWERRLQGDYRSILETLNRHTGINEQPLPEDADNHYTAVHLLDIHDEYRQKVENIEGFVRSIGLVAPVTQDPDFEHAQEIEEMLRLNIPDYYQPVEIFINGIPVYRPFVEGLSKPKEIQVLDDDGNLLAYGWACLNTASERYKRQIIEDDLRGIALLQRGIQVGNRNLSEEMGLYSSVGSLIYFRWYCGELHIVDPRIILSADRTRIRQSQHTVEFIDIASKEFRKLAKSAENWSNRDNAEIVVKNSIEKVVEIEEQVRSGVTRDRLPGVFLELGKAQSDIKKRKRHLTKTEAKTQAEEFEVKVSEMIDQLIGAQQGGDFLEQEGDTIPLSDALDNQVPDAPVESDNESAEAVIVLDIPERLDFTPRETQIYRTIMQAIADAYGGRNCEEFTKIALAVETTLVDVFGEPSAE